MERKTALILSDIHYGDLAQSEDFGKSGPASEQSLQKVSSSVVSALSDDDKSIDFVMVLGDLTSRGSPGEFKEVYKFMEILCGELDVDIQNLFLTYGNHDVDWTICELIDEPEKWKTAYQEAAANLGGMFAPPGSFSFEGP